jgi:hypothetical protein
VLHSLGVSDAGDGDGDGAGLAAFSISSAALIFEHANFAVSRLNVTMALEPSAAT